MEYLDENKQPAGFDVDFITEAARVRLPDLKLMCAISLGRHSAVWPPAVRNDIVAAATTITPERQKQARLSDLSYEAAQAAAARWQEHQEP